MVEKISNLLKVQKKYFIILTILSTMIGVLLWKAKWMLLVYMKLVYLMLYLYQTELLLIASILIISITVLNISKIRQKSYSLPILMKLVKTYNKNLYVGLGRKYVGWQVSEFIKMLMISLWLTGATLFLMLYTMPALFR